MANQLFYGKVSSVTPIGNGSNSFIRVRGDFNTASKTITNVVDVTDYLGLESIREGQTLIALGPFSSGTTVVSVDVNAATITVADFPATTVSNTLARVSPAAGDYFIASASFSNPNNVNGINANAITGSQDALYNGTTPIYAVIGRAADSGGNLIPTIFHKYAITETFYKNPAGTEISFYISWDEGGTEAESGNELYVNPGQSLPILALSTTESLAPIFSRQITGLTDLPAGSDVAAYQIELVDFFDDLEIGRAHV